MSLSRNTVFGYPSLLGSNAATICRVAAVILGDDPFGEVATQRGPLKDLAGFVGFYRVWGHLILILRSWRRQGRGRWMWTAFGVASLAGDVALMTRIRRTGKPAWRTRSLIDAAEAAVWTSATAADPTSSRGTVLGSVPTSIDAAYLTGLSDRLRPSDAKVLVPSIVVTGAQTVARLRLGRKPLPGQIGWPLFGVLFGFGLGRTRRALVRRSRESWREYAGLRVESAWWRGQHDVTMSDADPRSPHNLKKDLLVLEARGSVSAREARDRFEARKSELVDITEPFGAYLGEVARGLAIVPTDAWSIRLSPTQVVAMRAALEQHGDAQMVIADGHPATLVVVDEPQARRPGGEVRCTWGTASFVLPAAAPPTQWHGDPAPLLFAVSGIWKLTTMSQFKVPPAIVLPFVAVDSLAALAYRRATPTGAEVVRPVWVAMVSNVAFATIVAAWCGHRFLDSGAGEHGYPGLEGGASLAFMAVRYWEHLPPNDRRAAIATLAAIVIISACTGPRSRSWLALAEDSLSAVLPLVGGTRIASNMTADSEKVWSDFGERAAELIDEAYAAGVRSECELLAELITDAERALDDVPLPVDDADVVRNHLKEAREWLKERLELLL